MLPLIRLIRVKGLPILQQLQLEERLLRTTSHNWCIINDGTGTPTIVTGISGKPEQLIEVEPVLRDRIPVIKRFSGGGTVIVDGDTVFVTLICNQSAVPNLQLYPRSIMAWTEQFYAPVFRSTADFRLREHDYALGDRKFGGNAQSITKGRWLHHTSFLWDYRAQNMAYLKLPSRAPKYRLERSHSDFICCLKDLSFSRENFLENIVAALTVYFSLETVKVKDMDLPLDDNYPHTTKVLTTEEITGQ
ncbi:uncharacterized protein LOC131067225 [Cryptomeria japonica]|uniref:uncharacterized protein LOC131067225 n=1 Tax=Cryptomeria japonica TaxID=3369 RepID=UPI0027DA71C8|nr:uncharacterized protein LOC131067225 [Cryptomeria japonica]